MNEIIETFCRIIDFSNLFLVITDETGIIKSVSNRLSKHVTSKMDEYKDINGKCWYDFIDEKYKNTVIEAYNEVINDTSMCKGIEYPIGLDKDAKNIKWILSFVNHDYNLVISIGMPIIEKKDEVEFEGIRLKYLDMINKDREKINQLQYIVTEKSKSLKDNEKTGCSTITV
jgi:hypothetical protein